MFGGGGGRTGGVVVVVVVVAHGVFTTILLFPCDHTGKSGKIDSEGETNVCLRGWFEVVLGMGCLPFFDWDCTLNKDVLKHRASAIGMDRHVMTDGGYGWYIDPRSSVTLTPPTSFHPPQVPQHEPVWTPLLCSTLSR